MIVFLLILNFGLALLLPMVLGQVINRRLGVGWRLFGIGAVTFVLSQVGHIPFNWLVIQRLGWLPDASASTVNLLLVALFLGLSAGVFEESGRYLAYRFWAKNGRSWSDALMMGAGHGGIEAILLVGLPGLINVVFLALWQAGAFRELIPPEQVATIQAAADTLFGVPLHLSLLGFAERVFALCFHIAASVMVLQVFRRRQIRWLFLAIGWHTLFNALAVFVNGLAAESLGQNGVLVTEGVLMLFAFVSVWFIFRLHEPAVDPPNGSPDGDEPERPFVLPKPGASSAEDLEKSRYV